jgi:hypothetical protein
MQKVKFCLALAMLIMHTHPLLAQEKKSIWQHPFVQRWIGSDKDSVVSNHFIVLPALGYSPETGLEFGLAGIYNFYTHPQEKDIRTSNVTFIGTRTTKGQTSLKLESDIWTSGNTYHIQSELRYRNFPFQFYGLGNTTLASDQDLLTQQLFRAKAEVARKMTTNYYAGLLLRLDRYAYVDQVADGIFTQIDSLHQRGVHGMLGITQRLDTRNSNTYTTKGTFAQFRYTYLPKFLSSTSYTGHLLHMDVRHFVALHPQWTLGFQSIAAFHLRGNTPFYLLQELGGDQMMRGYYLGRYRDQHLITAQTELRWRLHPRLGLAGFLGTGSTFGQNLQNGRWIPSAGGGIRYFYDLEHAGSVRLEYAVGEQRAGEKRISGFYLSLKEAF